MAKAVFPIELLAHGLPKSRVMLGYDAFVAAVERLCAVF
jgi:hypothetical protein